MTKSEIVKQVAKELNIPLINVKMKLPEPPKVKNDWQVVVGNIGTVYEGTNGFEALKTFRSYVKDSRTGYGKASGETVTMFKNGEIHRDYIGTIDQE